MKERILLLFVAMIGMATSVGWAQDAPEKSTFEGTEQDVTNFKSYMGIKDKDPRTWKIIYGNGYEMTIEKTADASSDNQVTITFPGVTFSDQSNTITITNTDNAIIFGGSKESDLDKNTKITLKSGSVGYLIGGGWGTRGKDIQAPKTANVKDVALDIQGGTVGLIYSGGLYRSNVNDITLNVKNATVSHIYCGGFDQGQTTNTLETEWNNSVNHVNKSTLTMEKSTVLGYLFLGGGQGYSYSKEVEANVLNSTLHCGILGTGSNGRSDKVTATVTGCKFEKADKQEAIIEIAPLNRGIIKEISMTFDGCTFPSNTSDYAAYLGATYDYDGKSKVELEKVNVEFKGNCINTPVMCLSTGLSKADATVTGAKVIAAPSVTTGSTTEKAYTIGESKTWIFNNGFEITEDVTLTNKGALTVKGIYTVATAAQLEEAIKQTTIDAIELSGSEYALTDPLKIKSPITLSSAESTPTKATIKGYLVVEAEGVNIKNLAFDCNSTGTNYWLKNAITLFGNTITVDGCTFTGSAADNKYVANGIVIFPKTAGEASYDITGNTFTNFNQEVGSGENYWTSTALLLCDNTSITKKEAQEATTIPALTSWNETSLADASNTFTTCFANYIHQTENSYVYGITTTAKGVADGINSIGKDKQTGTIVATSVSNADILTAVNTIKPSLEGKFIVKSKDGSIVTDPNLVSTGTVFVLSKGTNDAYTITQQTQAPEVNFSTLEASTIEAGQPLSASILSGGSANVSGVFSWKNPATIVEKGTDKSYPVIFTPTDLVTYNVVESTYTFDEIKQYYTVQTGKCANGHLEIANANASNKYEVGSTLTVKPVANAHYAFDKYLNESGFTGNTYTVSENATLTAQFKAIMRTVTISITGDGTVNVNGESKSSSTITVQEGSVLTIQAVPGSEQVLSSLTAGGSAFNNNTVTVDKDLTIAATFAAKPAETSVVKVSAIPNGKINLYDAQGNAIASGSSLKEGEVISVVAVPDLGYKLADGSLKYNTSTVISDNKITVAKTDIAITATFTKQSFGVSTSVTNGTVTLKNNSSQTVSSGTSVEYGTELTAKATPSTGYKLLSLVVNGKEIPNGGSFVVTAKTTVTAVMTELAKITIDKTAQSFTYDGETKAFVIKTTPAGITGFTVNYSDGENPVNANNHADKAYTVTITRDADDTYAAVSETAKLIIKPAQLKGVAIPTLNERDELVSPTDSKGSYALGEVNTTTHIGIVTFTPTDGNYAVMTFSAAGTNATACDYEPASAAQLYSAKSLTRASGSSLNITVNGGNGSVKVLNGGVEATTLYVGQTITIQAIPATTEYAANATWNDSNVSNTKEVTLTAGENNVTVAFQKKTSPMPTLTIPTNMVYNGTPFAGNTISVANESPVKDWDLSFESSVPTNAGTYKIYASRKADENYLAVVNKEVGSFTITPKTIEASDPVATDILQGQALAQSILSGTANTDGTFEWIEPNKILNANAAEAVRFVPTSKNYSVKTGLKASVNVTKTDVTIRTLNLTITGEEHGTVSMTLDGNLVTAGATVTKGQELKVTATANTGYETSVQIDGSARTSYTIGETGNVEVKVTFTKKADPTPTPDPEPDVIDVTGVSIDATSKTLTIGESFALKATVKPANADNRNVSWSSSDATVASVDKDGNVKALKSGTCKITVTSEDGDYTATCDITVTIATGIDELLAANRIYTNYGQIIVEPAISLEVLITDMTGRIIYHDRIAEKITVSVSSGIYIVRLVDSKRVAATKVIVK